MSATRRREDTPLPGLVALAVVALTAAAVLGTAYAGLRAAERAQTPPIAVDVMALAPQEGFAIQRSFVGRIEGRRQAELAFELTGTVTRAAYDEGARVAEGAVIVALDTSRLAARRAELEGALKDAEAQLWLAEKALERRRTAGRPAFSEAAVDEAKASRDSAAAQLERIQGQIARVDVDMDKSRLSAPFDAVITRRLVDEGDVVSPGATAFVLLDDAAPEARIGLAGPALSAVAAGDERQVEVGGRAYAATVEAVVPSRDLRARTVDARLRLRTDWGAVNEGDLARLEIAEDIDQPGSWVPLSALTESSRGLFAVYLAVPAEDGAGLIAARREVEVLHQTNARAFVRGGLREGDRLITAGVHKLVPGLPVRIAKTKDGAAASATQ